MMVKQKSYNPLKMWGSYMGLFVGAIICPDIFSSLIDKFPAFAPLLLIALWTAGFLFGWIIHSIFRWFRK